MPTIQKVQLSDADTLLALSKKTFFHFFAHLNTPANMEAYAAVTFKPEKIAAELSNLDSEFYFAMVDGEPAGYIKLNVGNAQNELKDANSLEVERIYVLEEYHGKRIGGDLLNFAIDTAKARQMDFIWLGVWEHNHKAIGFYEHNGFVKFSSHDFMLGDDRQTDIMMKKALT